MAAGVMPPEFGGEFSPCAPGCGHRDCAAIHRRAARVCHHCDTPIGWLARFYDVGLQTAPSSVHALCEDLRIEIDMNADKLRLLSRCARPIGDDDWGSNRQIDAENAWVEFAHRHMTTAAREDWDEYALKATSEEAIDYGLRVLKLTE